MSTKASRLTANGVIVNITGGKRVSVAVPVLVVGDATTRHAETTCRQAAEQR